MTKRREPKASPHLKWKASDFDDLIEPDFHVQILIPLFRAMGFQEVEHTHGPNEFGKDITFWEQSPSDHVKSDNGTRRINYAVVAKSGKVTGSVSGNVRTIETQIKQAFGAPFLEKKSGKTTQHVDKVIVAASGTIKEQSRKAIQSAINIEPYCENIEFWDVGTIIEKLNEFLPRLSLPNRLSEIRSELNTESFTIVPEFDRKDVGFRVEAKDESAFLANVTLSFPNDSEGKQKQEEARRFKEEGGVLAVSGDYVHSFEQNEELTEIFGDEKPALLFLAQFPGKPFPVRIELDREGTPFSYEGLRLRTVRSGDQRMVFETINGDPIHVKISADKGPADGGDASVDVSLSFKLDGQSVRRSKKALQLWNAISSGVRFRMIVEDSGKDLLPPLSLSSEDLRDFPFQEFQSYLEDLSFLEGRLGWELVLPEGQITERDFLDARELRQVLETGSYSEPFGRLIFTVPISAARQLLEGFALEKKGYLKMGSLEEQEYEILDRRMTLGPRYSTYEVTIMEEDHEAITEQLEEGAQEVKMTFHEAPDSNGVKHFYRNFLPKEHQENFDKHLGQLQQGDVSEDEDSE